MRGLSTYFKRSFHIHRHSQETHFYVSNKVLVEEAPGSRTQLSLMSGYSLSCSAQSNHSKCLVWEARITLLWTYLSCSVQCWPREASVRSHGWEEVTCDPTSPQLRSPLTLRSRKQWFDSGYTINLPRMKEIQQQESNWLNYTILLVLAPIYIYMGYSWNNKY